MFDKANNIFENLNEGIVVHNKDTQIVYFNPAALNILQMTEEELLNRNIEDSFWHLIDENENRISIEDYPIFKVLKSKNNLKNIVIGLCKKDKKTIWVNLNAVVIFDENNEIETIVSTFIDITQRREALQIAHHKTYYNQITNLANSLSLEKKLINTNEDTALLLLKIDSFNKLSQYYGRKKTNTFLQTCAKKISYRFNHKAIFHIEKDTFALLLEDNLKEKTFIENFLLKLNEEELYCPKLDLHLTITAGLSYEKSDKIGSAKIALAHATSNKLLYSTYTKNNNFSLEINNEMFWSKALRNVIKNKLVIPVYQPIINNKTLEVDKYEVLMRVEYEDILYTPFHFLEISKKLKLYKYLTTILIEKVFNYFKNKDIKFSINLSTEDLMDDKIKNLLLTKVQNFHKSSNITIEIVESESINNFDEVNRFISLLKLYDCKISIDDFGSGYSNFEYILKLDADFIKIDGSLIKDIVLNENNETIVKTIASFTKEKNIPLIAEYVSSKEIYEKINSLNIEYSQGFYFGEPKKEILKKSKFLINETINNKNKKLKQLIYASSKNGDYSIFELNNLLKASAKRNKDNEISGYIVTDGQHFLQVIEGEEDKVNRLYKKISRNKKHTNINFIGSKQIKYRSFKKWNLGYIVEKKVIIDFLFKKANKRLFLPQQYDYDFALEFLIDIEKII